MATLQVRDLPEHIHRELVRQAQQERRSLAQQAVVVLEKGLQTVDDRKTRRRAALERIKQMNLGASAKWPDFVASIREDRER